METRVRNNFCYFSVALVLVATGSCLTYVFMSKGPSVCVLNDNAVEGMFRRSGSGTHWLLKAQKSNSTDKLSWEDEWASHRNSSILDPSNTWISVEEKGVYLVYIQVNFLLQHSKSSNPVDIKLLVDFQYDKRMEELVASHDTRWLNSSSVQDAKLTSLFLIYMMPENRLSVRVSPIQLVNTRPRPSSTFLTIIKRSDQW